MAKPMGVAIAPAAPPAVDDAFAKSRAAIQRYADLLAGPGVERGLIGPREVDRLWSRHILNCVAIAELIPRNATVMDVGSGAGLPGIVIAVARPDLRITLLEPLLRRTRFLDECVTTLSLDNVTVARARAEEWAGPRADVVTSRAVAPLDRLAGWCLPLLRPGGEMIALKGRSAHEELLAAAGGLASLGAVRWDVLSVGANLVEPPATVVRVVLGSGGPSRGGRGRSGGQSSSRAGGSNRARAASTPRRTQHQNRHRAR